MYPQTNPYAYANPYQNYNQNFQQLQTQQVVKVHGRSGAEAYQMTPNSSALLLDETEPIVYLAQTDGAGYKTVTAYDILIHKEMTQADMSNLEQRITRLEEMFNESNSTNANKGKSSNESPKSNQTNGSNLQNVK